MDKTRQFVITVMLLSTIALVPLLFWKPPPEYAKEYFGPLFGFFLAKTGDLINWLIGATQKSSERSDKLAEATAASAASAAPPAGSKPLVVEAPATVRVDPGDPDDPTLFAGPRP